MNRARQRSRVFRECARAFKAMLDRHCSKTGDTLQDIADELGVSYSYLSNLTTGTTPIAIDLYIRAARFTADRIARLTFDELCANHDGTAENLITLLADMTKEDNDVINEALRGIADGHIDHQELLRLRREIIEKNAATEALLSAAEASLRIDSESRVTKLRETQHG